MARKFPSITEIANSASVSVNRFPLVLIAGVLASFCAMALVEIETQDTNLYRFLVSATAVLFLGISVFFAIDVYAERSSLSTQQKRMARFGGFFLLTGYYLLVGPNMADGPNQIWIQFALLVLSSHLLVAFAPFIKTGSIDEFWEFNKSLFLRFLMSSFYAAVLYIGMVIALVAIENLLEIDIDEELFLHLFIFMCGVFITWFFISGIPEMKDDGVTIQPYLKPLKVFVQYVLIPLVTVYITILYLYLGKIIIQWELPNGWVSYLVLSFSIAGILSLLLLYPIQNKESNEWIRVYSRGYYLALIPLIGLLMVSIYTRISDYGVTINRYLVATLAVWLTGIVLYFIFSKAKNIKAIPFSLCLTALAVSFGPLGASAVSERSQLGRFEEILSQNEMIDENGHAIPASDEVSFGERKELSSILDYLFDYHGEEVIEDYLVGNFQDTLYSENRAYRINSQRLMGHLELEYVSSWESERIAEKTKNFSLRIDGNSLIPIEGYDVMFSVNYFPFDKTDVSAKFDNYILTYYYESEQVLLENDLTVDSISFDVRDILEKHFDDLEPDKEFDPSELSLYKESESLGVQIFFHTVAGTIEETFSVLNLEMTVLIKEK